MEKAADLLDDQVEKFAVATVEIPRRIGESAVTVYGIAPDSRYWTHADVSVDRVLTGEGLLKKCEVELGEKFTAHDQTQNEDHTLTVDGTCNNGYDLNIYMSMEQFSELFDKDANHVNGFASDEELDESYVTFDLTPDKMRSMADQMRDSMGQVMQLMVMLVTAVLRANVPAHEDRHRPQ